MSMHHNRVEKELMVIGYWELMNLLFALPVLTATAITLGWLSNNMSADHEDVDVPVQKAKPKQAKVVVF